MRPEKLCNGDKVIFCSRLPHSCLGLIELYYPRDQNIDDSSVSLLVKVEIVYCFSVLIFLGQRLLVVVDDVAMDPTGEELKRTMELIRQIAESGGVNVFACDDVVL